MSPGVSVWEATMGRSREVRAPSQLPTGQGGEQGTGVGGRASQCGAAEW